MEEEIDVILKGVVASQGTTEGKIFKIENPEISADCPRGYIIVAEFATTHLIKAMHKCSGIITEKGGITSHVAVVARELGIPCIVNCKDVLKKLNNEMEVILDGTKGCVYGKSTRHPIRRR